MENYGANVVSFLLTLGSQRWYVVGAYVHPNTVHVAPVAHQEEQELAGKLKEVETILLGELNARLGEPRDERKEDLVTALADHGLEDINRNFTPRQRYRGLILWTCQMHR